VRFRRRFQKPRQVDENERLWLTFDAADYFTTVWLNGEEVGRHEGAFDQFSFEVTKRIRQRNELVVEVECPAEAGKGQRMFRGVLPPGGGLWGDVALEVRREAYLRDLLLRAAFHEGRPRICCDCAVIDEQERPLELYILLDGHTVLYDKVSGNPHGRRLQVAVEVPQIELWQPRGHGNHHLYEARAELIDVATKLDIHARSVGFRDQIGDEHGGSVVINGRHFAIDGVLDLTQPVVAATALDDADKEGKLLVLGLPMPKPRAAVVLHHTRHHPSIVGWRGTD
jgi:beta-mannosidase